MQAKCIETLILKSEWRSLVIRIIRNSRLARLLFLNHTSLGGKGAECGSCSTADFCPSSKTSWNGTRIARWLIDVNLDAEYWCFRHGGVQNQSLLNRISHMPYWSQWGHIKPKVLPGFHPNHQHRHRHGRGSSSSSSNSIKLQWMEHLCVLFLIVLHKLWMYWNSLYGVGTVRIEHWQ